MNDLISRQAAIDALKNSLLKYESNIRECFVKFNFGDGRLNASEYLKIATAMNYQDRAAIYNIPAISTEEIQIDLDGYADSMIKAHKELFGNAEVKE